MHDPQYLRPWTGAATRVALPLFSVLCWFFPFVAGRGASAAISDAPPKFVATNVSEYWNPPSDQKQLPQPIRIDLLIYYYDPEWKMLWGEASDGNSWFDTAGAPLPLKAGQRVRIEGTYIPAAGIDGSRVHVTVLGEHAMPAPVAAEGLWENWRQLSARWVTAEGYVCHQQEDGPRHVRYDLLCDGRVLPIYLLLGETEPVPQLVDSRIRVNFVYVPRRDLADQLKSIEGWTPYRSDIRVVGRLAHDSRFQLATTRIDRLDAQATGEWVHISGVLHARIPGRSITVRDQAGQLLIATEQPIDANPGDTVDVVGRLAGRGLRTTLLEPVCRVNVTGADTNLSSAAEADPVLKLRLADQVNGLRPDQASRHYPVQLTGVVTWSDPGTDFFFLQDASGGVRVRGRPPLNPPPPGSLVTLEAETSEGAFAPSLDLRKVGAVSRSDLPAPEEVTLDQALSGAMEAQQVKMRGYVRSAETVGEWAKVNLTTATGEFHAYVRPSAMVADWIGSLVEVTGVCTAEANSQRQLTGVVVWLTGNEAVQIEQPRPADPFVATEYPIGSLRQFVGARVVDRMIRVKGMVLYNRPGRFACVQNGDAAVMVLHRNWQPLAAGEWIEAVGLPGRDGNRQVLREAVWRRSNPGTAPTPVAIAEATPLSPELDGRLVTLRGRLLDKVADDGDSLLMIQLGTARLEARLDGVSPAQIAREGSLLELTGVYSVQFDEDRNPHAFALQLRSVADIRVLKAAPWWTTSRALTIAGALGLCVLLGIGWVVQLKRRVRHQTEQIRTQLENESRLSTELERATRLESLGVLAGGIAHDFNNLLTVVIANLGLAAMDERVQEAAGPMIADAERGARRAAELTQQLLTFAKGGDPVRRSVSLPDVVKESAEFARHGSHVRCKVVADSALPPADVDRAQISRVVHNLVLNATQAMPNGGTVTLRLTAVQIVAGERSALAPGQYVRLSVSDDGPGIPSEHLGRIFEPYFSTKPKNNGLGLATVHSIVRKHGGHIEVRSEAGRGTTFDIWLPAAKEQPKPSIPEPTAPCAMAALRVLFMDDEEVIRRAAASVLRQLGHEATLVGDGHDVVREYEAALRRGRKYDIVILDLTVPGGLGGRAALDALKQIDPEVRAIVSSGYSQDPVLSNYRRYGFSAVVPKPYQVADLARAIQEVARRTSNIEPQTSDAEVLKADR